MAAFTDYYRTSFIVYPFLERDKIEKGTTRSYQRYEQCSLMLETFMGPGFESLMAKYYFDSATQSEAEKYVKEAIADSINEVNRSSVIVDEKLRGKLIQKLQLIKVEVMYKEEMLNETKISKIYDELKLEGNESLFKQYIEIKKYSYSLNLNPRQSRIRILNSLNSAFIQYSIEDNLLSK